MQRLGDANNAHRRVIVIDDNLQIHKDVKKILQRGSLEDTELQHDAEQFFGVDASDRAPTFELDFELAFASQGEEGVKIIEQAVEAKRPFAMALVDMRMPPGLDGVQTTKRIWEVAPDTQVVLCTAYSDYGLQDIIEELGQSDRLLILKKPYEPAELALLAIAMCEKWSLTQQARHKIDRQSKRLIRSKRILNVMRLSEKQLKGECRTLQDKAEKLSQQIQRETVKVLGTQEVTCSALANLAESRDPETGEHLKRMQVFSQLIAEQLAISGPYADEIDSDFLNNLWRSSPLHDIGKVGIPDHILLKPGRLMDQEFEIMKLHAEMGAEVLKAAAEENDCGGFLKMAAKIARHHHERFDGNGYPDRLAALDIPLEARIVTVADVFDALTSNRVYKDAIEPEEARRIITSDSGSHFDPIVVDAFLLRFEELVSAMHNINSCLDKSKLLPTKLENYVLPMEPMEI